LDKTNFSLLTESSLFTFAMFAIGMQLVTNFTGTFVSTERIDTIMFATVIR